MLAKNRQLDFVVVQQGVDEAALLRLASDAQWAMLDLGLPLAPSGGPGYAPLLAFFAELVRKLLSLPEVV